MGLFYVRSRLLTLILVLFFVLLTFSLRDDQVLTKTNDWVSWSAFVPMLSATKTGTLDTTAGGDLNGNGIVNPGDRLAYTVTINNTGADPATGVALNDTIDANTTLVGGSVIASAIAVNDAYSSIGNVGINVPAAGGLLANDLNPNGSGTLSITSINQAGIQGTLSVNTADGSFTFNPNPGFTGTTNFSYTLSNGTGLNDTATVTINVSGLIWFINNSAANGDGRLGSPFSSIANFNAGAADDPGDNIFIYTGSGSYDGSFTLLNDQKIIGQGASASLAAIAGVTVPSFSNALPSTGGTNPIIITTAAATNAVNPGTGNTIRGVTIGNTTSAKINSAAAVGTLTIGPASGTSDVILNGTGRAVNLTGGGTLAARFASISSDGGLTGITLSGFGGNFESLTTNIQNSTGIGISVSNSLAGGTFNFGNTTSNSSGGTGVFLSGNANNQMFAALNATPDANQRALVAQNNTGVITSTSGTLSSSGIAAVEITNASGTVPLNLQLTSVSTSGGTNGIVLTNTSSSGSPGGFRILGSSSGLCGGQVTGFPAVVTAPNIADCTGGTIQNTTGAGVLLNNAANISFTRIRIINAGDDGIGGTTVTNFTLASSLLDNNGNAVGEANLDFDNLFGTSAITNSVVRLAHENNVEVRNTSNNGSQATLSITGCTINNASAKTQSDDGVLYQGLLTANMSITVSGSALFANRGDHLQATTNDNANMNAVFSGNTLTGGHSTALGQDIVVNTGNFSSGSNFTYDINGNSINGAILSAITATLGSPSTGATMQGRIRNNIIGTSGVVRSGSLQANGVAVNQTGGGTHTVSITGNTMRQWYSRGISASGFSTSGNLNLTIQSNSILEGSPVNPPGFPADGTGGREGIIIIAGSSAAGDSNVICAQLGGAGALANNVNRGPEAVISGEQDFRLRARSASTFRLPGYGGGAGDTAAVAAFVAPMNTSSEDGTVGVAADRAATSTGFVGGAGCTQPAFARLETENKSSDAFENSLAFTNQFYQSPTAFFNAIQSPGNAKIIKQNRTTSTEKTIVENSATSETSYRSTFISFISRASETIGELTEKISSAIAPTAYASGETVNKALGTLPPGEQIIVQFKVTVDAGLPTNKFSVSNTAEISAANHATINSTTAVNTVVHPPTISKAFGATSIALNGTTSLTFTIGNANPSTAFTNIAFTDNLPAGLVVATPNGLVNNCGGGTVTATAGANSISVSALSRAANSTCTIVVNVTGTSDGAKNNTTGTIASTEGGTGLTSNTATLNVIAAPTFTKAFGAATIPLNGSTSLSFTITNSSSAVALTNVSFTDALPSGLVVAAPPNQTGSCGTGTITANAGAASISLAGATLAASSSCTFSVNVSGTSAGAKNNSVQLSTAELGAGATAIASIVVVAPPAINKTFLPASILVNETSTLTISISNPSDNTVALTGVGVTDNFPAGLQVSATPGATNSCSTGTFTPTAGATSVSISGAMIPVNTTCTFAVQVKATSAGAKNNVTGNVTSTEGGAGGTASAILTVTGNSYEADVAPRPDGSGDGVVNPGDITQVRRFVAGLDLPYQSNEFQRVDSAPLNSLGDGFINAGDITQVRRYAAGLDTVQIAGGPTGPAMMSNLFGEEKEDNEGEVIDDYDEQTGEDKDANADKRRDAKRTETAIAVPRELRPTRVILNGNILTVAVNLTTDAADTPANAVGFTLLFDTMVLSNPTNIRLGANAPAATTITENTSQAVMGRVGIVLDLPVSPAQTFPTGDAQLVLIDFTVAPMPPAATTLSFGDMPVQRFVGDINGNSLPTTFSSGSIMLFPVTAASVTISGRVVTSSGRGIPRAVITMTDHNGNTRKALTNPFGYYRFFDIPAGQVVVLSIRHKNYRFAQPTIVLQVNEDLSEVNFAAMP